MSSFAGLVLFSRNTLNNSLSSICLSGPMVTFYGSQTLMVFFELCDYFCGAREAYRHTGITLSANWSVCLPKIP